MARRPRRSSSARWRMASGEPAVIEAFESFVNQPGVPLVSVTAAADGSLQLAQSRYRPLGSAVAGPEVRWKIPFCADLYTARGGEQAVHPAHRGHRHARGAAGPARGDRPSERQRRRLLPLHGRRGAVGLAPVDRAAPAAAGSGDAGRQRRRGIRCRPAALPRAFPGGAGTGASPGPHCLSQSRLSPGEPCTTAWRRRPSEPLLERALVSLYGEPLRKLGYDATPGRYAAEPPEQQLLRRELIGLVGLTGRDPAVRSALTPVAERSVADPAAVEALLRWRVWAIGLQERGAPVFEHTEIARTQQQGRADTPGRRRRARLRRGTCARESGARSHPEPETRGAFRLIGSCWSR